MVIYLVRSGHGQMVLYLSEYTGMVESGDIEKLEKTRNYFMNWNNFVIFNLHVFFWSFWLVWWSG